MKRTESSAKNVAVVLAGGTGQRIGLNVPKQLIKVAGKSILEHTLDVFEESAVIDEIIVVMHKDFIAEVRAIVERAGLAKVSVVLPGGATRNETSLRAIEFLRESLPVGHDVKVLIHDAVRPLVSTQVIAECVAALDTHEAVDVAIPTADTMIVTRDEGERGVFINDVPDRAVLQRGQTPQAFWLSTIWRAYGRALQDPAFQATDDCGVVLRYLPEVPIVVVRGEEHNMKVTQPIDLVLADRLFQLQSSTAPLPLSEHRYREQLAGTVTVVFGASYGIGADIGDFVEGHGGRVFRFSRSLTGTHVENPDDVAAALAVAYREAGRIDHVVNTAGVLRTGELVATSPEAIEQATAVNYLAPVHIARAAFPYLAESGGQLLLYTSSSYTRGRRGYSLYSSAKAATVNLTQALAEEWAPHSVRINCVNPERTRTPMRARAFGDEPVETLLASEAVAQASVDVLLSAMTGHVVDVRRQDPVASAVPELSSPALGRSELPERQSA
ncbi:bifunctional cytidylyltransferase/SDR family oxidoreductase [Streptomyces sp. 135]|uniref:bifunctional cytidylyltransferase/SDR family oxidoreductase n=1 Tax=Streptomyces sp. 135 TaxID=2838850 RepID=UPI001CBBDFA8|nr:bifunctional cytidylyltransferase/SDR family oxidoreductase [Streptomyces sp. 135]